MSFEEIEDEATRIRLGEENLRKARGKTEEVHKKECPHCRGQILIYIDRTPIDLTSAAPTPNLAD